MRLVIPFTVTFCDRTGTLSHHTLTVKSPVKRDTPYVPLVEVRPEAYSIWPEKNPTLAPWRAAPCASITLTWTGYWSPIEKTKDAS